MNEIHIFNNEGVLIVSLKEIIWIEKGKDRIVSLGFWEPQKHLYTCEDRSF